MRTWTDPSCVVVCRVLRIRISVGGFVCGLDVRGFLTHYSSSIKVCLPPYSADPKPHFRGECGQVWRSRTLNATDNGRLSNTDNCQWPSSHAPLLCYSKKNSIRFIRMNSPANTNKRLPRLLFPRRLRNYRSYKCCSPSGSLLFRV